jgi:hypothetical protein
MKPLKFVGTQDVSRVGYDPDFEEIEWAIYDKIDTLTRLYIALEGEFGRL